MLDWAQIDTVLLDMDGTLLDLHFDNYFWLEHLPKRWAEISGISLAEAKSQLQSEYAELNGKLQWYCLDYWGERLQLPITELKREVMDKIQMRPDVPPFLTALKQSGREVVLVTNAHPGSLSLKLERTDLAKYIDTLISTHEFGVTKESWALWQKLQQRLGFDNEKTLFVDDSLPILTAAQNFGIKHLLAVANPDSQQQTRSIDQFPAITDYTPLLQDILAHSKLRQTAG
ncbi:MULTISPECIES: GMP/IMP nucleotidase [unclassified Arsukibacterium]|uniref:GMP/IMP nucleotidase n=1 Tax=unclassified Arsukibacterium TaxID=2635278 RepID=UPI000C66EA08|nr:MULTISPECIES: GMP/IMP nucleotidase [unclassified Arsukibacterium]MAA94871.1 HAD family hydrolase [Rheinheimera sp.]MBM34674.1 HAD family hydrolase [Rheinheimera sp.]HAW92988.1 GMP/IMP nucleotidase [Candidatus Azambacteria bacterium]|tara:strand:- start:78017 stop:78706 length:690 start_codon:yes stop_codon:yes gene_type:complete